MKLYGGISLYTVASSFAQATFRYCRTFFKTKPYKPRSNSFKIQSQAHKGKNVITAMLIIRDFACNSNSIDIDQHFNFQSVQAINNSRNWQL